MRSVLSVLLVISFIITQLTTNPMVYFIGGIYICLYIITSLPYVKGTAAKITIGLLVLIFLLLIGEKDSFSLVVGGASTNLSIVCILIVTPLLGIPVRTGDYVRTLSILLSRLKNNVHLTYIIFLLLTHILSIILNIGSIIIIRHLINSTRIKTKRLIASILNRGYTTTSIWSPYLAVMALVVNQLGIEWSRLALHTISFALLSLIVAYVMEIKELNLEKSRIMLNELCDIQVVKTIKSRNVFVKMIELLLLLALSMILVLLVEKYSGFGMALSISFVAILFPLIWCIFKGSLSKYKQEVSDYVTNTVPKLQNEFTMFLVAGLFSSVFVQSKYSDLFINFLNQYFGSSSILMSLALSLTIILTGIVGLHPAVMLTIFVTALQPEQIGFTPVYFAALLLGSIGVANTISSGTAVNNLLANELKLDLFTVSFRWNRMYALTSYILLLLYLQLWLI